MTKEERNSEIIRMYEAGNRKAELSRLFGISYSAITQIIEREKRRVESGDFCVLTTRERNMLARRGIKTRDDLKAFLDKNPLTVFNYFGEKTEAEIKRKLKL